MANFISEIIDSVVAGYSAFDPNVREDKIKLAQAQAEAARASNPPATKKNYNPWIIGGIITIVVVILFFLFKNGKS